jgi:hypothetical protein
MFGFIKLEDVRRYVAGRFPELVKSDDDGQETRLSLADYVSGAVKVVSTSVGALTKRVGANETALNKSDGEGRGWVQADIVQLRDRAGKVEEEVRGIESRLDRSGVVSGIVEPKGEVTFDDLIGFATEVADEGYSRLQNYFLHEMARHGYEGRHPDFIINDRDSGISVSLSVIKREGRYARSSGERKQQTWVAPESYPSKFGPVRDSTSSLLSNDHDNALYHNRNERLRVDVEGSANFTSRWKTRLSSDLETFYKAYMFGYVMNRLDARKHQTAVEVMKQHGLEEHTALATRMKEIIAGGDANLANAVATHYSRD